MASIFEINTYMQLVDESLARRFRLLEGLADHDLARLLVRYPEHNATAAMVGHGAGVLDERRTQRSLNSTFSPSYAFSSSAMVICPPWIIFFVATRL